MQSAMSDYVKRMEGQEFCLEIFIWDMKNFVALVSCYRKEKIVHLEMPW